MQRAERRVLHAMSGTVLIALPCGPKRALRIDMRKRIQGCVGRLQSIERISNQLLRGNLSSIKQQPEFASAGKGKGQVDRHGARAQQAQGSG
jgi:hypothetical protein